MKSIQFLLYTHHWGTTVGLYQIHFGIQIFKWMLKLLVMKKIQLVENCTICETTSQYF